MTNPEDRSEKFARAGVEIDSWIDTPIHDHLTVISGTNPQHLLDNALERFKEEGRTQAIFLLGPPMVGKSTLVGEQAAISAQYILRSGGDVDSLKHVAWEKSQARVSRRGHTRDRLDDNAPETRRHYSLANDEFANDVLDAMGKGGIVFIETPGIINRGDLTVATCARHEGRFRDLDYDASFIVLSLGPSTGTRTRQVFEKNPDEKLDAIEKIGADVQINENISSIGGGDITAVDVFRKNMSKFFYEMKERGISTRFFKEQAKSPDYFEAPSNAAAFIERVYAPYFLRLQLKVPPTSLLIARNYDRPTHTLYQQIINEINTQKDI